MAKYVDTGSMSEDDRIDLIGRTVVASPLDKLVGFITENEKGKAERYVKKLTTKFPQVRLVDMNRFPGKNLVVVRVKKVDANVN